MRMKAFRARSSSRSSRDTLREGTAGASEAVRTPVATLPQPPSGCCTPVPGPEAAAAAVDAAPAAPAAAVVATEAAVAGRSSRKRLEAGALGLALLSTAASAALPLCW